MDTSSLERGIQTTARAATAPTPMHATRDRPTRARARRRSSGGVRPPGTAQPRAQEHGTPMPTQRQQASRARTKDCRAEWAPGGGPRQTAATTRVPLQWRRTAAHTTPVSATHAHSHSPLTHHVASQKG